MGCTSQRDQKAAYLLTAPLILMLGDGGFLFKHFALPANQIKKFIMFPPLMLRGKAFPSLLEK